MVVKVFNVLKYLYVLNMNNPRYRNVNFILNNNDNYLILVEYDYSEFPNIELIPGENINIIFGED